MEKIIHKLREKLSSIIKTTSPDGILLSGGLDSSILATFSPEITAFTVSLEGMGEDIFYSQQVVKKYKIKHCIKIVKIEEALEVIPTIIKILNSFDLALPNDIVVYFGLKVAKKYGIKRIISGDGGDELFVGYNYMKKIKRLKEYLLYLVKNMNFSINKLAEEVGIEVVQPYLDKKFIEFAKTISIELKLKKVGGNLWGKWILREGFKEVLPKEIIWREKTPLEYGSGMNYLRKVIEEKISEEEFKEGIKSSGIKFINKEHFYYYKIFTQLNLTIPKPQKMEKECPVCKGGFPLHRFHCKICGFSEKWG
jgi:asparagine synthase (glutamine-hydrolysing)